MRPKVSAIPTWVMAPALTSLIMIAPVPAKTRAKVPNSSAQSFFISVWGRWAVAGGHDKIKGDGRSDDLGLAKSEAKERPALFSGGVARVLAHDWTEGMAADRRWKGGSRAVRQRT